MQFNTVLLVFYLFQLTSKRVGVIKTSAVEEYTKSINGELHSRLNIYVKTVEEAVQKIRYLLVFSYKSHDKSDDSIKKAYC